MTKEEAIAAAHLANESDCALGRIAYIAQSENGELIGFDRRPKWDLDFGEWTGWGISRSLSQVENPKSTLFKLPKKETP